MYLSKHFDKFYLINLKDHLCLFERAYLRYRIIYQHKKQNTSKFCHPFFALFSHLATYKEVYLSKF